MTDWLQRARCQLGTKHLTASPLCSQISKGADGDTDKTDERHLTSVLSVPQPGKFQNFDASNVSNGGTPPPSLADAPDPTSIAPPISEEEEALLRAWLAHIGETDPEGIAVLMNKCRLDMDARRYFVKRARGELCLVNSNMDAYLNEALAKWKLKEE